jgi:hypothetical protein
MPDFDPTLSGDYQIPWVPLTSADETEQGEADIPLEDFFCFFEQDPSMRMPLCFSAVLTVFQRFLKRACIPRAFLRVATYTWNQ